jgi:hypothetical protein
MVVMDLFADKSLGGGKKAVWIIFLLIFPAHHRPGVS